MELNLLVLRCKNIDESRRFYEKLGLEFVSERHGDGPTHFSSCSLGFVLELYPQHEEKVCDHSRLGFNLANPGSTYQKLTKAEKYQPEETTTLVALDPDGRKIELRQKTC